MKGDKEVFDFARWLDGIKPEEFDPRMAEYNKAADHLRRAFALLVHLDGEEHAREAIHHFADCHYRPRST